jgi:FlaA1/EpsC-like NDP-sugar epimerase
MKKRVKSALLVLLDILLLTISFSLAYAIRFEFGLESIPDLFFEYIPILLTVNVVLKLLVFSFFKLYHNLWKYASIYEFLTVIMASAVSNGLLFIYIFFIRSISPRSIFIITAMLDVFFIGGSRIAFRIGRRLRDNKSLSLNNAKRILIIGAGEAGVTIAREMLSHKELQSKPVAFVDENPEKIGKVINGIPVVGNLEKINEIILKKKVDEIIIAIPSAKPSELNKIYEHCASIECKHCKVRILPSVTQLIDGSVMMSKVRDVNIEDLLGREPIVTDLAEICSYIANQTILVTGGGGSIGSELCTQIASFNPKRLIILDNYENNLFWIHGELKRKHQELEIDAVVANIRDLSRMEQIFKTHRPDIVYHAAAHKHVPLMEDHPCEAIKNNVFGTLNVAMCADKYGTKRFVLISTDKAVNPTNVMGATKRIAEMIVQGLNERSNTDYVAVRFGNVLGSNGSVIPLFKKQIEEGGPVTVTHPEVTRFFMTIPEAVSLVLQAAAMAKGGEIFVLDMGQPVKILDLAKNMIRLSGYRPYEDIQIEITGLRPGEKLYEELLMAEEGLQSTKNNKIFIAKPLYCDFALLKQKLEQLRIELEKQPKDEDIKKKVQALVPTYHQPVEKVV